MLQDQYYNEVMIKIYLMGKVKLLFYDDCHVPNKRWWSPRSGYDSEEDRSVYLWHNAYGEVKANVAS